MPIIITYDVPERHVELKKSLFSKEYQDYILHLDKNGVNKKIFLPNTTVYHKTNNAKEGLKDIQDSCDSLGIKLERCVSTQWGPDWSAIWGKPFGS